MSGSETSDREFEVERVLNHRRQAGKLHYLIRWKEFGEEEDSWEPLENLHHCRDLVAFYNRQLYSPLSPDSSSTTLTSSLNPVRMPGKVAARSRSSSRSRTASNTKKQSKKSSPAPSTSRGSSRSPARRSTRTTTTTKTEVKKQSASRSSPSRSSPARSSPARTGRSPTRSTARSGRSPTRTTTKTTAQSRFLDIVTSPLSSQRDTLSRTPIKDTRLTKFDEGSASRRTVKAAAVQRSEVVVQRSWTSSQSGSSATSGSALSGSSITGRGRASAIEQSFSDEDDVTDEMGDNQKDEVDSDTKSWFGQKRQEMLRSFQTSGFSSRQRDSAVEPLAIKDGSGWSFTSSRPLKRLGIRNQDLPVLVFIACLITIGVTFLIEQF